MVRIRWHNSSLFPGIFNFINHNLFDVINYTLHEEYTTKVYIVVDNRGAYIIKFIDYQVQINNVAYKTAFLQYYVAVPPK